MGKSSGWELLPINRAAGYSSWKVVSPTVGLISDDILIAPPQFNEPGKYRNLFHFGVAGWYSATRCARRGKTDAAFGRLRLLPVIADGDRRARPAGAGDVSRGHRHLESQCAPLAPPIPVGPAVVAEIQSNQMDITLVPLPTGY